MRLQQQDGAFESSMASCSSRGALLFLHVLRLSNGFATRCFLLHHIVMSNLWLRRWWMPCLQGLVFYFFSASLFATKHQTNLDGYPVAYQKTFPLQQPWQKAKLSGFQLQIMECRHGSFQHFAAALLFVLLPISAKIERNWVGLISSSTSWKITEKGCALDWKKKNGE